MYFRIIPKLDIKGPNLVKGINFEGLRVLGKPENFARIYYEQGADELFYQDAVASLYGRNSLLNMIEKTSKEIFIPLCVGGGLRSIEDIREVLRSGADKVAINTAAIKRPQLIREVAETFGSSTVVVSIEAIKRSDESYEAYIDYGRQNTGLDAYEWAQEAASLGAGELVVTSINREGTGEGYDLELTRKIATSVSIPVIACGGCGKKAHVVDVIRKGEADAVSMASILHYDILKNESPNIDSHDYAKEGNIEFLRSSQSFSTVDAASIREIKKFLYSEKIPCRYFDN